MFIAPGIARRLAKPAPTIPQYGSSSCLLAVVIFSLPTLGFQILSSCIAPTHDGCAICGVAVIILGAEASTVLYEKFHYVEVTLVCRHDEWRISSPL